MTNGPGKSLNSPPRAPGNKCNCCRDVRPIHTPHHIMTNRQHQLIMALYSRCDELSAEMDKSQRDSTKYIQLLGAFNEVMDLAKKLTEQFTAEAEVLRQVESRISTKVNINA